MEQLISEQAANILYYAGIVLMGGTAAGAVIAAVASRLSGKRLKAKLEAEYGKKRR